MKFDYRMEFNASFRNLILIEITVGVCNFSIDTCKRNDNGQRITIIGGERERGREQTKYEREIIILFGQCFDCSTIRFSSFLFSSFLHYNVIHFWCIVLFCCFCYFCGCCYYY